MWGIRESEEVAGPNLKKNSFSIKDISIIPQIYIPNSLEEAYSVFSWAQNGVLILNSTGKYQIFFKALATTGVWSNVIKATLIVNEPNAFQRNPLLHLIWVVPIIFVTVLTIPIIKIKKKRKI